MAENGRFILSALDKIAFEFNNGVFVPILEDDFVARFYFQLLNSNYKELSNKVFVKTRVLHNIEGTHKVNKYDIAFGTRSIDARRDYVSPEDILEFKIFASGFTFQQLSKRRNEVHEDIDKLHQISQLRLGIGLFICVFDMRNWLNGYDRNEPLTRIESFCRHRDELNKDINIIGISVINNKASVFSY